MNKKKTNLFATILNIILLIAAYILYFSTYYLTDSITMFQESAYGNFILDFLLNKICLIKCTVFCILGFFSIVLTIQNRKNKKLFFWQIAFSIFELCIAIIIYVNEHSYVIEMGVKDFAQLIGKIICGIIPIICVITNIVLAILKKYKIKLIKIISYVAIIVFSIFAITGFQITDTYIYNIVILIICWSIITIVMQLIYICNQDKDITESNKRKILNIIIYYVLQLLFTGIFMFILIYSLLTIRINEDKWKKQVNKLLNDITILQGSTIEDIYIPVVKNDKYGFINEKGQEKVPCEYDKISEFHMAEINNDIYYVSFVKKGNEYYIISKSNDKIDIGNDLKRYVKKIENSEIYVLEEDKMPVNCFNLLFNTLLFEKKYNTYRGTQNIEKSINTISLENRESKYYYRNKNYSIMIEPIGDKNNDEDVDYELEPIYDNDTQYEVTINKTNGESYSETVRLPELKIYSNKAIVETFSDGSMRFLNDDLRHEGWYNNNGERKVSPEGYDIIDVKSNKIILYKYDDESEGEKYFILNKSGKVLLKATELKEYDNVYILENDDNKKIFIDEKLNKISDEYDEIFT